MTDKKNSATFPLQTHSVWILFDHILSEMGSSAHENLHHDQKLAADIVTENLTETAAKLGLKISELVVNVEQAADASSNLTPLIKPLGNDDWLVLSGFSRGRIKATLINHTGIDIRLLRISELIALLQAEPDRLVEWYAVELKAPMDASEHHDDGHMPPFRRLVSMMKIERKDLWRIIILALASGLLSLATPIAVQSLVNTVALGGMRQPLVVLSVILFIFLTFFGAVSVLQSYIVELIQRRVFVRMAADMAYRLPKVKWEVYEDKNGAELVNRFFDVLTVQKIGAFLLLKGSSMVLQSGIGLLVLAAYHPILLLFDLIVIAWLCAVIFIHGRKGVETSIKESVAKYSVVAWLETLARNDMTFKFSGGPELARERADKLAYHYLNARKQHYRILLGQNISLYALYAVAGTALLAVGGFLVMEGKLTLGQLVASELIVFGVLVMFSKFDEQLEYYYDLMAAVDKLGHLLDLPVEREAGEPIVLNEPVSLVVYDLEFNYPDYNPLFQSLSFEIKPGEKVALFGEPGSGKSTLADLLTGLRLPSKGRIEINQLNIQELQLESLRKYIAVVGCTDIIEDTLFENIRLGRPEISVAEVRDVLKRLNLMHEPALTPEGMHTKLSLTGSPLSSTQIRKLLLARAIVSHPRLLILDGLLDEWQHLSNSSVRDILFCPEAPWTLLVLTRSMTIAQFCQRTIELPSRSQ